MRIVHLSDIHFTGGDNDTSPDWRGFDTSDFNATDYKSWLRLMRIDPSKIKWSDPSSWVAGTPNVITWQADSRNRSDTLASFLTSYKETLLKADVVVITGDLTDSGDDSDYSRAEDFIGRLTRAGYSVYCTPGNHDYARWGLLAWASEDKRNRFHQLPGTSHDKNGYPWVVPIVGGNDTIILLDSMKGHMDAKDWGGVCEPTLGNNYHIALDPSSIAECLLNPLHLGASVVVDGSWPQLAQGKLGSQKDSLCDLLASLQISRRAGGKVIVCLHHSPYATEDAKHLDDGPGFLELLRGRVDVLLFGHTTPDGCFVQNGQDLANDKGSRWQDYGIPLVNCVNLQHAGRYGDKPSEPYPVCVIDTDLMQIEIYGTDGKLPPKIIPGFGLALPTPVLTAPADGAKFSNYPRTMTLAWQSVPGANQYLVEVEYAWKDASGTVTWGSDLKKVVSDTQMTFDFVGSQPGRWRITAMDQSGAHKSSVPSNWRGFDYTVLPVLPTPVLTAPADGAKFSNYPRTMTLAWQSVPGANQYLVEVEYAWKDASGTVTWGSDLKKVVSDTQMTFDFVGSQPGRWRITAMDQSGAHKSSVPSNWRGFDYTVLPVLPTPVLTAPADGAKFSNYPRTMTLAWQSVPGANQYLVEV